MDDVYLGNPLLKKANVAQEFTQEQILEFMACKNDPVYFAKQHVFSTSSDPPRRQLLRTDANE